MNKIHRRWTEEDIRALLREELSSAHVQQVMHLIATKAAREVSAVVNAIETDIIDPVTRTPWWRFFRSRK